MRLLKDFRPPSTNLEWLWANTLFLTEHGSQAYGTNIAGSDTDYKGFCVAPLKYQMGYLEQFHQAEFKKDPDCVVYDLRKFFKLAADCNPSIIEVLFTDPSSHVIMTPLGDELVACRDEFLSKKAKFTFSGYAVSQLKRIEAHYRWLRNPPKSAPDRASLGLPDVTIIPRDQLQAAQAMVRKKVEAWTNIPVDELDEAAKIAVQDRFVESLSEMVAMDKLEMLAGKALGFSDNFLELLDLERAWNGQVAEWRSYQTWLETRNPARAALEAKHGYDTKHGMHLVRLLRMGREILTTGKVLVRRPDAEELLAIRAGAWSYEQLVEWAKAQDAELDVLYRTTTVLPNAPDRNYLDSLCVKLTQRLLFDR